MHGYYQQANANILTFKRKINIKSLRIIVSLMIDSVLAWLRPKNSWRYLGHKEKLRIGNSHKVFFSFLSIIKSSLLKLLVFPILRWLQLNKWTVYKFWRYLRIRRQVCTLLGFAAKECEVTVLRFVTVVLTVGFPFFFSLELDQTVLTGKQIQLLFNLHKQCPVGWSIARWDKRTTSPQSSWAQLKHNRSHSANQA